MSRWRLGSKRLQTPDTVFTRSLRCAGPGYTRSIPSESQYLTSTAVIMGELMKVVVSTFLILKVHVAQGSARLPPGSVEFCWQDMMRVCALLTTSAALPLFRRLVLGAVAHAWWPAKNGERLSSVFSNPTELIKTGVPAFLYLVQNNLQYIAVSNMSAATYQVTCVGLMLVGGGRMLADGALVLRSFTALPTHLTARPFVAGTSLRSSARPSCRF